jgi:hypothetical protein
MKKIMFNDRYGLTEAVLSGRKTMTRRIVRCPKTFRGVSDVELEYHRRLGSDIWYDCVVCDADGHELGQLPLPFEVGDVVAVAQSYKSIYDAMEERDGNCKANEWWCELCDLRIGDGLGPAVTPGYRNKMFVRADLMPHRIRITDLWFERLQDISDEGCLKEEVMKGPFEGWYVPGIGRTFPKGCMRPIAQTADGKPYYGDRYRDFKFDTPREAFAALIDRISGRGTWKSNPWVVAYEFELINKED